MHRSEAELNRPAAPVEVNAPPGPAQSPEVARKPLKDSYRKMQGAVLGQQEWDLETHGSLSLTFWVPLHPRTPEGPPQERARNMVRHLLSRQHRRVPLGRLPQKIGNRVTAGGSPEMPLCWSIAGSLPSPHCTKGHPEVSGAESSNPLETALRSGERRVEGRGLSKREELTS